jgi:pimeloyl-ACP methyl ester carboxylesterase
VQEIVLVGHSMGGLVARSAGHQAQSAGHDWVRHVHHVFCLGSPHLGAPLERGANFAGWALAGLPETRPVAKVLNARSAGIKDLRYGALCEEDWRDLDPDALWQHNRSDVPFLEHAQHYTICATVTRDPESRLAAIVGDLLVLLPSASGRGRPGRSIPFPIENGLHVGGITHFHLLNHPAVYEQMRAWLERAPA